MKHLDNIVGPVKRPARRSFEALQKVNRFGAKLLMRGHFEDFRRQFESVAASVGMDRDKYAEWLTQHGLDDSVSSRHSYIIELDRQEERS